MGGRGEKGKRKTNGEMGEERDREVVTGDRTGDIK